MNLRHILASLLITFLASSCTIHMKHGKLKAPSAPRTGVVTTAPSSTGLVIDDRVGWGTLSIFAIPVAPVFIEGDGNAKTMAMVQDALRKAGYEVRTGSPGKGKVLTCHVEKIKYCNYTYLFPIVPTWGGVTLKTELTSNGTAIWTRSYKGAGSSLNFFDGYSGSHSMAMTKVLNQMVADFASDSFQQALTR